MMILRPLRSFIGLIAIGISILLWSPVVMCLGFLGFRKLTTWSVHSWNRFVLWVLAIEVRIHGIENYDKNASCLIVSNHQSLMDIPALMGTITGDLRMVAKKELFSIPFFGWSMKAVGCISIDRGNSRSGKEVSQAIAQQIKSGMQIWVAPEGTRSPDGRVGDFKKGSFAVAIEAQVPIQPVAISGAINVLNKKHFLPQAYNTIDFSFCKRIDATGLTTDSRADLAQKTRQAIVHELERLDALKEPSHVHAHA